MYKSLNQDIIPKKVGIHNNLYIIRTNTINVD